MSSLDGATAFPLLSNMIRLVLPLLLVTLSSLTAQARIGETLAECEIRYGPVVERVPARQAESDKDACIFSRNGITVLTEFRDGKVWKISYSKVGMDSTELQTLLAASAAGGGWSAPLKISTQEFRTSNDHERLAIFTPGKRPEATFTLVIATKTFANANREAYVAKLAKIPAEIQRRIDSRPMKDF